MVTCLRCEDSRCLKYDDFNFAHDDPRLFVSFQFGSPWIVVLWNGVWFIYLLATLIYDVISSRDKDWLAHHSNWGFILILSTTATEVTVRINMIVRRSDILHGETDQLTRYTKVQWCLYNMSSVITLLHTVMAIAVWPEDSTFPFVNKHFVMSLYVITNVLLITSVPTKVFHFYQPLIPACVYVIFASIYQAATDDHIYLVSGYKSKARLSDTGSNALAVCMIIIVIPCLHGLVFCIYKLRQRVLTKLISQNLSQTKNASSPVMPMQRDITATDVVLHKRKKKFDYVEVRPEIKDDSCLKFTADRGRESMLSGCNSRLNKSETDLRQYVSKNGFYCDFAPPSQISHYKDDTSLFDERGSTDNDTKFGNDSIFGERCPSSEECRGNNLIVVKKCRPADDDGGVDNEAMSDTISTVSSDYLSQYMVEDRFAYL